MGCLPSLQPHCQYEAIERWPRPYAWEYDAELRRPVPLDWSYDCLLLHFAGIAHVVSRGHLDIWYGNWHGGGPIPTCPDVQRIAARENRWRVMGALFWSQDKAWFFLMAMRQCAPPDGRCFTWIDALVTQKSDIEHALHRFLSIAVSVLCTTLASPHLAWASWVNALLYPLIFPSNIPLAVWRE